MYLSDMFEGMAPCNIAGKNSFNTNVRKEDDFSLPCKLIAPRKQVEIRQITTDEKSNGRHTQTRDKHLTLVFRQINKARNIAGADKV